MDKDQLLKEINTLIENHELLIWHPKTGELICDQEIESACKNGPAIQINLSENK